MKRIGQQPIFYVHSLRIEYRLRGGLRGMPKTSSTKQYVDGLGIESYHQTNLTEDMNVIVN